MYKTLLLIERQQGGGGGEEFPPIILDIEIQVWGSRSKEITGFFFSVFGFFWNVRG